MALEMFSPLQLMASRFVLSGGIMLLIARARGTVVPQGRELWLTALFGLISLGIGNACLTYAETFVPTGIASIIVATSPFWIVGLEALVPGGAKLHPPTLIGMLIGLGGVAYLFTPSAKGFEVSATMVAGIGILQLGCFGWCLGAILQRRLKSSVNPAVSGAIQQLAVGLFFVLPALLLPQPEIHFSWRGLLAMLYLVVFGSIVGYTSFVYAMAKLPVAVVSIYMYVNPVVAVILGWLLYREHFGQRELIAMLVIFLGSAIVKWTSKKDAPTNPASAEPPLPRQPALAEE